MDDLILISTKKLKEDDILKLIEIVISKKPIGILTSKEIKLFNVNKKQAKIFAKALARDFGNCTIKDNTTNKKITKRCRGNIMKISPYDLEKYIKKIQSYSIEFEKIDDYKELLKQYKRITDNSRYHQKHYPKVAILIVLSKNNNDLSKVSKIQTKKRGRPKKVFIRDNNNPFFHSSIQHEVAPHIHYVAVGKGSRALTQKIVSIENKKAKKCVAKLYSNKGYIPYKYFISQATSIRNIGDITQYLDIEELDK